MSDLFSHAATSDRKAPFAEKVRPATLEDIVGQHNLLKPGSIFRNRLESDNMGAALLYGPPGTGKTTIAKAIGNLTGREFHMLHAAHEKTSEIERIAKIARDKLILVFIDEIHKYNKTTAEMLLDYTESGLFHLIGATTENPNFAISKALLSRMNVYELFPVSAKDIAIAIKRAVTKITEAEVTIQDDALESLSNRAGGDVRRALNVIESCYVNKTGKITITKDMVSEAYSFTGANFDKRGDQHYDMISAFIKSMRGSDPDATLYWLARLIKSGEDPRYIARRIFIHAAEDVGLADPSVLQSGMAAFHAAEKIGYPEVSLILSQAALHVCLAPKSNAAHDGINAALAHVNQFADIPVPMHLRDTHYAGAKDLGREGYLYPHSYPNRWVEQDYAPGIKPGTFFIPKAKPETSFEVRSVNYLSLIHI